MKYFNIYSTVTLCFLSSSMLFAQKMTTSELARLQKQSQQVTIIRDNWGIAHVYGKTDADAVFGMLYAQCEDDFKRVEMNYIEKLGQLSEVKGQEFLYNDLEIKLLIDIDEAKADYKKAAPWLQKLLNSYADGINYYLYKHPEVQPALLNHFEPWFPLLWTDGSIGAISTAGLTTSELKSFYGSAGDKIAYVEREINVQTGSNGFAIAPSKTVAGNAILYINPHTTFYFRPEIQISSDEGLQAYGAVTWGQFFIYQGFNENCGWMHTSSNVDVADLYAENIVTKNKKLFYEYNTQLLPVVEKKITIKYLENGKLIPKTFTSYFTNHGPIMAKRDGKWISLKSFNRSVKSLEQSWIRTKSKSFVDYKKAMDIKANTSNNTVYADKEGNIAYWHGNFVPIRDPKLNWSKVVDGTTAATQWKGLHEVSEIVHSYNPENGWLQNCNSTPFTVAGTNSPNPENYPPYMAPDGENFRGLNAVRLLDKGNKYTLDRVIADGYDTKLTVFEFLIPALISSFEKNIKTNTPLYDELIAPITVLKNWDYYAHENSVATTLAVEWAYQLEPIIQKVYTNEGELDQVQNTIQFLKNAQLNDLLPPLQKVLSELKTKFGSWEIHWGQINRFQRTSGAIALDYDDAQESLPIGFGPAVWGSLPAFKSSYQKDTQKRYGSNGNSFVCAVEFGTKIKAKSLLAGGNSGNPNSKHFFDQAKRYQEGQFKEVLFYKEDVLKHAEKTYHPGE
ncbi:Glutaryl-7-aminocephalosporanic-acid acylase [Flavobacterium sp. CECT 9288]|uniref:penicillin acylase family protein n=1 Tax=Flavobacterium sp. CECT 9288 TaxID=2845819 RepID=UPI001E64BC4D|nr:penicillin acylase family protein [Flavobacterium sp. CECT 9288]CAH0336207.1 Glutaryl-7-aminocephalosporanic-acid acylase [Flavobacterium sp. CECT 9288]